MESNTKRGRGRPTKKIDTRQPVKMEEKRTANISNALKPTIKSIGADKTKSVRIGKKPEMQEKLEFILSLFSQAEVATRLKCAQNSVSMWSRNKQIVPAHLVDKVNALFKEAKGML